MLDSLRKKMKIDKDKFYIYLSEVGNTVSSTIPIAIYEALKDRIMKSEQKILLAGFGVGFSWGGCILNLG
jgi:3-oxoacyl-[acyl-carrier-protein] synthase-3